MNKVYLLTVLLGFAFHLLGCAANGNSDGSCKRTCGSRPIGGGNLLVYAVGSTTIKWTCTTDDDLTSQTIKFLVVEETSSATKTDFNPKTDIPKTVPVGGVAFSPEGFPETASGQYDTPSNELCTDSCGVASISFTPKCMTQDIQPTIVVPGWQPSAAQATIPTVSFSVKKNN